MKSQTPPPSNITQPSLSPDAPAKNITTFSNPNKCSEPLSPHLHTSRHKKKNYYTEEIKD